MLVLRCVRAVPWARQRKRSPVLREKGMAAFVDAQLRIRDPRHDRFQQQVNVLPGLRRNADRIGRAVGIDVLRRGQLRTFEMKPSERKGK